MDAFCPLRHSAELVFRERDPSWLCKQSFGFATPSAGGSDLAPRGAESLDRFHRGGGK